MTKREFMEQLKNRLKRLPQDEFNDAIEYYEQYFDDADSEDEAIASLGSPEQVATKIFADFALTETNEDNSVKEKMGAWKVVWIVILAIFAAPVAIPVAAAIGAVAIALVVSAFAVVFSLAVSGVAVVAVGIFGAIISFVFIATHFPTTIFFVGLGLLAVGLGVLLFMSSVWLAKVSGLGLLKLFGKILRRFGR